MAEKRRWGQQARWEVLELQIRQTDGVTEPWEAELWYSRSSRRQPGKRQPGAEGVKPQLKWAVPHFPWETKQRLLSLIIPLTSSGKAPHALPLSFAVLGITACHCCFVFSGSWNESSESSCHWGLHQCHKDAAWQLYFIVFSRRSLLRRSALRSTV